MAVYTNKTALGYRDDGEYGAGYRLLKVLQDAHLNNIAVFLIRHYGGQHLGPDRHRIMEKVYYTKSSQNTSKGNKIPELFLALDFQGFFVLK